MLHCRTKIKDERKLILESLTELQPKEESIPGVLKASKWAELKTIFTGNVVVIMVLKT